MLSPTYNYLSFAPSLCHGLCSHMGDLELWAEPPRFCQPFQIMAKRTMRIWVPFILALQTRLNVAAIVERQNTKAKSVEKKVTSGMIPQGSEQLVSWLMVSSKHQDTT